MNMYRLITLIVICISFNGYGQVMSASQQDSVMKLIERRIHATKTLSMEFRMVRSLSAMTMALEQNGTIYFQHSDKLRYVLDESDPWIMVVNGSSVFVKDGDKPIQKRGKGMSKLKDFIVSSLNGDTFRNNDFSKSFFATGQAITITLTPKPTQLKKYMKEIRVQLDNQHNVTDFVLVQPNGDSTQYIFSNLKRNTKLEPKLFQLQ